MGRCHYCLGKTNCLHRNDGACGQCLPGRKPHLFLLEAGVIQTAERDMERIRILDMLGITAKAARSNADMLQLRTALLGTKIGDNKSEKPVYSHRIYWCSCHVHDNDVIAGSQPGSLICKPGFNFISMEESRERLLLLAFVPPRLKNASPLALALASEASSLSEEVVQRSSAMKELQYGHASNDRAVQLQLDAANDTIKKLTAVNSSNELRLIAQDEQIKQLGQLQPRKSINAVHFNIRREYAKMQSEADELRTVLPHNMETIKELCRRSGVY